MALEALIARLEVATTRLESLTAGSGSGAGASAGGDGSSAEFVEEYEVILNGSLKNYLDLSAKIGGEVNEQAAMVERAFRAQRAFLVIVSKSKNPNDDGVVGNMLKNTSEALQQAIDYREKNRSKQAVFNHLSTISEGIPALGWVMVSPKPAPHVAQMKEAAEFYSNRVLKDFKDKDETQKNWAKSFPAVLGELQEYVKKYHTTGLSWNPKGGDASSASASAPAPSKPAAAATPAPAATGAAGAEKSGLFAALNAGGDITKGLKKVSDDQKTHKNPALRAGAVVQEKEVKAADIISKPSTGAKVADLPPKVALEGNKWAVEYQKDNKSITIADTDNRQVVYIYKCINSVVVIKGKVNQVTLDGCRKTDVVIDSVISSIDLVNSQSCKIQITGKAPTVNIDKTDGVQLYLSKEALQAEILFAKSSEINVLAPGKNEDDDMRETALPEQCKASWDGSKFVTTFVEHKG